MTAPAPDLIGAFRNEYRWLSNFAPAPLTWDGARYETAEAAYQAGKTLDPGARARIAAAVTPGAAKRAGRRLPLRPGWEAAVRYQVMDEVLDAKFAAPRLRNRLLRTGDALLVEGNVHHDQQWGDCACPHHRDQPGENHLGLALMRLRARLAGTPSGHWARVAAAGHRPHLLPAGSRDWTERELHRVAVKLRDLHGMRIAISGGAMGTDLWWAEAAAGAGSRTWLYLPFPQQADGWTPEWRARHAAACRSAARVAVLGDQYRVQLLHARNSWMLRDCQALVAVLDPRRRSGGTHSTVAKARGRIPVISIDPRSRTTMLISPSGQSVSRTARHEPRP